MAWLLCIFAGLVLVLLHKKWKKWKKWYVVATFTALFACALASTPLGGWLAGLLGDLVGWIARQFGGSGPLLAAILVLVGIPAVVYGLWDRKADKWEMGVLILLPLLFIISSGPVAEGGGNFTDAVAGFGSGGLSYLVRG